MNSSLGAIYTPPDFAQALADWAIHTPADLVLDMGVGEGAFVFAAQQKLQQLNPASTSVASQIYGAEIDPIAYNRFSTSTPTQYTHILNQNFFDLKLPPVNAVIGNPPYVRRRHIGDVADIRQKVLSANTAIKERDLTHLTDLYIYFLLYATAHLQEGGRLATIIADPWLNVRYGNCFKDYLLKYFKIEQIISLDRRVFEGADTKPVLLLATKLSTPTVHQVQFIRVKNGLPVKDIFHQTEQTHPDIQQVAIPSTQLVISKPWGEYLKSVELVTKLTVHPLMTPIENLAETYIGVQTLAKEFFVLKPKQTNIESQYLRPFVYSLADYDEWVLDNQTTPQQQLFYCTQNEHSQIEPNALNHIRVGELTEVEVRGKNQKVIGYQNKERIQKANRQPWYSLERDVHNRGLAPIFIPRLIYRNFRVVWNKAKFIAGDAVICFKPKRTTSVKVYLAILNSSIMEILLRSNAQVYGGGTYNIGVNHIKKTLMPNVHKLSKSNCEILKTAYTQFLATKNRQLLDHALATILEFDETMEKEIQEAVEDLRRLAVSAQHS